jgi:hypothetical protein
MDAMTAAFVVDCKEAATNNTITLTKMIEVFWTGGLADDLRQSLEEHSRLDRMKAEHFDPVIANGLGDTLRQAGLVVINDLQ